MTFFRVLRHLLPRARAWRLTADKKLRSFFEGLAPSGDAVKNFFDAGWLDIFPNTTRELDAWELQWGLRNPGLTEEQRRSRLDAAWKALGGQSPRYIQDALRGAGFDVFVHEWWVPGTDTARSPLAVLRREFTNVSLLVECGEALAACGEDFAEAGNSQTPAGYPLVNKVIRTTADILPLCGEEVVACGEEDAACGLYRVFRTDPLEYVVPRDPATWPYFLYIGGEVFPETTRIPLRRRPEFEELCLKICPTQQRLGILIEYE